MDFDPAPVVPLPAQPPARLVVDAPLPEALARGLVRAESVRLLPVYGQGALGVSPRIGHLHVTVDGGPWRWLDASGQPININKFNPGRHTVLIELVDANHHLLTAGRSNSKSPRQRRR